MLRYVILGLFIFLIYRGVRSFFRFKNVIRQDPEVCPSCQSIIRVSGDNMVCPRCNVKLGRNQSGQLLIRIN